MRRGWRTPGSLAVVSKPPSAKSGLVMPEANLLRRCTSRRGELPINVKWEQDHEWTNRIQGRLRAGRSCRQLKGLRYDGLIDGRNQRTSRRVRSHRADAGRLVC